MRFEELIIGVSKRPAMNWDIEMQSGGLIRDAARYVFTKMAEFMPYLPYQYQKIAIPDVAAGWS